MSYEEGESEHVRLIVEKRLRTRNSPEWGVLVMGALLITVATLLFRRRRLASLVGCSGLPHAR